MIWDYSTGNLNKIKWGFCGNSLIYSQIASAELSVQAKVLVIQVGVVQVIY